MMKTWFAICTLCAVVGGAAAEVAKPATWVISERVGAAGQATRSIPIGEITRAADGTVTLTPRPAPELDKVVDELAAAWKAYKPAAEITITEQLVEVSGMTEPVPVAHKATFRSGDAMYKAAAIRAFADAHHLTLRGLSNKFIEFDTHHGPAHVDDAPTTFDHFRKGTGPIAYQRAPHDYIYLWLDRSVRPEGMTAPMVSATDPTIALAPDNDPGTLTVATIKLFRNGTIDYAPAYARDALQNQWRTFEPRDLVVQVLEHGDHYTEYKVRKSAPNNVQAQILQYLVRGAGFAVSPVIDPAQFR